MAVDGLSIAAIGAGTVFVYAGIKGKSVLATFQSVLMGTSPANNPQTNPIGEPPAPEQGTAPGPGGGGAMVTNIPKGKGSYSQSGLQKLWTDNGGAANTAAFAAKVAEAESGGSATVTSSNPDGGTNVGIFQLDTKGVGSGYTVQELSDANLNTQITIMATNNGVNWQEWGDPVTAAVGYHYNPGDPVN